VKTAATTAASVITVITAEDAGRVLSRTPEICRREIRVVFITITNGRSCAKRMAPGKRALPEGAPERIAQFRPVNWFKSQLLREQFVLPRSLDKFPACARPKYAKSTL
jgi:hypothetical protein